MRCWTLLPSTWTRAGAAKTDGPKSAILSAETRGVEMAGRAGPGRVATETGIRNQAPSIRAQEKIRRSGTPLTPILLLY